MVWLESAEKIESRGLHCGSGRVFKARGERLGCGRCGLYCDDAFEARGQPSCKETDTGKKVPGEMAFVAGGDLLGKIIDKKAIDLKEAAMVYAIVEAGGVIGEGRHAPLSQRARWLGCRAFGHQFCAFESGNLYVDGLGEIVEPGL